MTEHEKLLAGKEYDYRDQELQEMITRCRHLVYEINTEVDIDQRSKVMNSLFKKVGSRLTINGNFGAVYGSHISFGDDDFINGNCYFQDSNLITLGDRVIVAPDTKFYCGEHSLDASRRFGVRADGSRYLITYTAPISVGSDVWIGGNVTVIGGVNIGNNVVIAAGAVVVNDIPDNCVAGGVPAKVIKKLPNIKK